MPADGQHRYTVRFNDEDAALVELAAAQANLAVSGLIRECAVRYAFQVARDRLAGRVVHVRAANGRPRDRSSRAIRERAEAAAAEREPSREPIGVEERLSLAAARRLVR